METVDSGRFCRLAARTPVKNDLASFLVGTLGLRSYMKGEEHGKKTMSEPVKPDHGKQ